MLAIFAEALLTERVFFQRDIHGYWYPQVEAFVRVVAQGSWPFWNPWFGFGAPMWADPAYQLAYPLTWLNLVLVPAAYFKLYVVVHALGAGVGAYLLGRRLGVMRRSAFTAAALWVCSGPLLSSVSMFHHFAGAAWMPWVLLALDRALSHGTLSASLLLGALAGGQLLAGSADMAFMTALIGLFMGAAYLLRGSDAGRERVFRLARVGVAALGYAVLLASAQWLPTFARLGSGSRLGFDPTINLYWSLHPLSLLDTLVPGLLSELPVRQELRAVLFESREPLLACLYLGVPALALAGFGLVSRGGRGKPLLALGVVLLVGLALGRHAPLLPALLELPLFGLFRYPVKYLIPASLLCALLAAHGVEAWGRRFGARERRGALAVVCVSAVLALLALAAAAWLAWRPAAIVAVVEPGADSGAAHAAVLKLIAVGCVWGGLTVLWLLRRARSEPPGWLSVLLLGLVIGDALVAGRSANALAPPELLTHRPQVLEAIEPAHASRVLVMAYPLRWLREQLVLGPAGWRAEWRWALGRQETLQPPSGARWGVAGSYDGDFTGLAPPSLNMLTRGTLWTQATPLALKLLRMGGVDYVVALHDPPSPELVEVGRFASVFAEPVRVLRVQRTLPRAYVVDRVRPASGPDAVEVLRDPAFDPSSEVLLPEGTPAPPPSASFEGEALIVTRRADRVELEVTASSPAHVVLIETDDPGWHASVDGRPAPIRNANLLFRGVFVPAGTHRVAFEYRPRAELLGLALSSLGLAVGLGYWELRRRRPRGSGHAGG